MYLIYTLPKFQEEDVSEKALLALLRPPDIDSGGESVTESSGVGLIRQRTMTLSIHTDEEEPSPSDSQLQRQRTITLTKSSLSMTDSEGPSVPDVKESPTEEDDEASAKKTESDTQQSLSDQEVSYTDL